MNATDIKKLPLRITYTNRWGNTWEAGTSTKMVNIQHDKLIEVYPAKEKYNTKSNYVYGRTESVWIPTSCILQVNTVKPSKSWVSIDSVENHVGRLAEGSILKLRNGNKITAKSFLVNYSIPNVGQVQTGVFDTNGKFHSIEEVIAVWR